MGNRPLGMVWLPRSKVFLGREAGKLPMSCSRGRGGKWALRLKARPCALHFLSYHFSCLINFLFRSVWTREYLLGEDRSVEHVLRIFSRCRSMRALFDSDLL